MKKKIIIGLVFSAVAMAGFAGCKNNSTIKANFDENEYIFSVNQQVNFYDNLTAQGVKKSDISFVSSNEDVLALTENGFLAKASGETYLLAKYKNSTLASVKVVVRYKFASPKNFIINQENGVLTWDNSYAVIGGEKQYATDYKIAIMDIADGDTDKEYEYQYVEGNSFKFEQAGSYRVNVVAKSNSKYIEDSLASDSYDAFYNAMGLVQNLRLTYESGLNGDATFTWDSKDNATYDVYINDIKVVEDSSENTFTTDFSSYTSQSQVKLEIDAKDQLNQTSHTRSKFFISKFAAPNVKYNFSTGDGFLSWDNNSPFGYTIYPQGDTGHYDYEILNGFDNGLHELTFVANGGQNEEGFFLTSDPSQSITVAKLATPNVNITFAEGKAILGFANDEYIKRYKISYAGGGTRVVNVSGGMDYELNLSNLVAGQYTFYICALPTISGGAVTPYTIGDLSTTNVINSDDFAFNFYVLEEIENLTHGFDNLGNSVISFDSIPNANKYNVTVNGESLAIDNENAHTENGRTSITLPKALKDIQPTNNKYEITVEAYRNEGDSTHSVATKTLEILPVSTGGEYNNGELAWLNDNNFAEYNYAIFSTNNLFEEQSKIDDGTTGEKFVAKNLEIGYYTLKVITKSNNYDKYLDSNYYDEENILVKNLKVTTKLDEPNVVLKENNGQYTLEIDKVEYAEKYKVFIDDTALTPSIVTDQTLQKIVYPINANLFDTVKTYTVKIVASVVNRDSSLYLDSNEKVLFVTKLPAPEYAFENIYDAKGLKIEERLSSTKDVNANAVYIDGALMLNEQFNVKDLDLAFNISLVNKAREHEEDEYFIDSTSLNINCVRVASPTDISFLDGYISFVSADHNNIDEYYLTINLVRDYGAYKAGCTILKDEFVVQDGRVYINYATMLNHFSDEDFVAALVDANKAEITVTASFMDGYKTAENGEGEILNYLPSKESATLSVEKLVAPEISFDKDTQVLSWQTYDQYGENNNITFSIFVNDVKVKSNYVATSINLSTLALSENELLGGVTIKVEANNSKYITSDKSNPIDITKLSRVDGIRISKLANNWQASVDIAQPGVQALEVNGSLINVDSSVATFELDNSQTSYSLQFISKKVGDRYYINSTVTNVQMVDLSTLSFEASLNVDDQIVYNDLSAGFNAQTNPIVYSAVINDSYAITLGAEPLSLQEIEDQIGVTLDGFVSIKVISRTQDYTTIVNSSSRICYGEISSTISTEKLASIDEVNVQAMYDTNLTTQLDQKSNAYAFMSWRNAWGSTSNLRFSIQINDEAPFEVTAGDVAENYSFAFGGSDAELTIKKDLLTEDENVVKIIAKRSQMINSEEFITTIQRCIFTTEAVSTQVSGNGILTITSDYNYDYVVQVAINGVSTETVVTGNQLDLMQSGLLGDKYGQYTIKIIPFDPAGGILPSLQYRQITGEKIQGIESALIDELGRVELKIYGADDNNLEWLVRAENITKSFYPTKDGDAFYIPLINIVNQFKSDIQLLSQNYTFEFNVRKANSVYGDWKNVEFAYNTTESTTINATAQLKSGKLGQDYLIFNNIPDTLSFAVIIVNNETTKTIYVSADEIKGYWKENEKTFTQDISSGDGVQECYALSLNTILADFDSGDFAIYFSRMSQNGTTITQYNQCKVEVYKFSTVIDITIDTNFLKWDCLDQEHSPTSYLVEFYIEDAQTPSITVESFVKSVDLRTVGLAVNTNYKLSITAISSENDKVSSNKKRRDNDFKRYSVLPSIVLKDGKIMFDEDELKRQPIEGYNLFTLIEEYLKEAEDRSEGYNEYFGNKSLQTVLNNNMSSFAPFYSIFDNFDKAALKLEFIRKEGGAITSQSYVVTTTLFNMIPDLEVINTLYNVSRSYSDTVDKKIRDFAALLYKSSHGVGSDALLLDDFGVKIPAGQYVLKAYRCNDYEDNLYATGIKKNNVESDAITLNTDLELTAAPNTTFSTKANVETGRNEYFAKLTAVNNISNYKMLIRKDTGKAPDGSSSEGVKSNPNYKFLMTAPVEYLLQNNGGVWTIKFKTQSDGTYVDITEELISGDEINLTQLIYSTNNISSKTLEYNETYQVDIFAIFDDDHFNGKSLSFKLNYLDLDIKDRLTIENGNMQLSSLPDDSSILMKYEYYTMAIQSKIIPVDGNNATIDLDQAGLYNFIMLSLQGSISGREVKIESESYKILDIYKYNTPVLTVNEGNIVIQSEATDNKLGYQKQGEDEITIASNNFPTATNINPTAITGENNTTSFNKFYGYAMGLKSGTLKEQDEPDDHIHTLVLDTDEQGGSSIIYISSNMQELNARMLAGLNSIKVENGIIKFNDVTDDTVLESASGDVKIIYEVTIEEYNSNGEMSSEPRIIYLEKENAELSSEDFGEGSKYVIKATKIAATQSAVEIADTTITTINGNHYILANANNNITYSNENGLLVLRSATVSSSELSKAAMPTLDGIYNGVVNFTPNQSIGNDDLSDYFAVFYERENSSGATIHKRLYGQYTKTNGIVQFIPDDPTDFAINNPFKLKIYACENNKLYSLPIEIDQVYRLPTIKADDIDIEFNIDPETNAGKTYLNLEKYFQNVLIDGLSSYYKVEVKFVGEETQSIVLTDEQPYFEITKSATIILQALDNQSDTASDRKKIINSTESEFVIAPTEISKKIDGEDVEIFTVEWDENDNKFAWSKIEQEDGKYEFYYELTFEGSSEKESGVTSNYYYMPSKMGIVEHFVIRARKIDNILYGFSSPIELQTQAEINLFASGSGKESDPYIIENNQQFLNIAKRNQEGSKFYFKLQSDITLTMQALSTAGLIDDFYGELDGNGKTITVKHDSVQSLAENSGFTINLPGTASSVKYDKFSALFKSVTSNAVVKNLKLNCQIDNRTLAGSNIMYSGIALYNYGEISNIQLNQFTITQLSGNGRNNIVACGVASINYGKITGCTDESNLNYQMEQQLPLNFAYCSISTFNLLGGKITNSFNKGNKSVMVATDNNSIRLSGISVINNGEISLCGNDGTFTVDAMSTVTSLTVYLSGITQLSQNGILKYVYNNGEFTKITSSGTAYISGVAYSVNGGTIGSVVDTTSYTIVNQSSTRPTHDGANYSNSTITIQNITTVALPSSKTELTYGDYKLVIEDGVAYIE